MESYERRVREGGGKTGGEEGEREKGERDMTLEKMERRDEDGEG